MQFGQHSLYFASFDGKLNIVCLLVERGAEVDLPTDVSSDTESGHIAIVILNNTTQDDYGFTALGIACQEGHIEVARLLIDHGAAIDYRNKVS